MRTRRMCGCVLALLIATAAAAATALQIDVVEETPRLAAQLAASVDAALCGDGDRGVGAAKGRCRSAALRVEPGEPLALANHICEQAHGGAACAVGAWGGRAARLAAAGAARAALPLLLVRSAPAAPGWEALSLFPHPDVLARVGADLCRAKGWSRAVLLHEGSASGAPQLAPHDAPEPLALLARRLPPLDDADPTPLRNLLLVLKKSGATRFIVWGEAGTARRVLAAAQRVGLLAERHEYVLLALDLHTQDLEPLSHGGANVTGVRLYDPDSEEVKTAMREWTEAYMNRMNGAADVGDGEAGGADEAEDGAGQNGEGGKAGEAADGEAGDAEVEADVEAGDGSGGETLEALREEVAAVAAAPPTALLLARHGAKLVRAALRRLALPAGLPHADCACGVGAFHADTLLNYLRSEEWEGEEAGGAISWDADGGRRALQLEVVELERGGRLTRVGSWAPRGLQWQRRDAPAPRPPPDSVANRTFNVLVAVNPPYVMYRQSPYRLSGNERYEGFCIELIDQLSKILQFNYTFVESTGSYGSRIPGTDPPEWDGMLGRLMKDEDMHLAITDLTITAERENAVDFTTPFMNLGISILYQKPKPPDPKLFAFLLPFSHEVWIYLGLAYLLSSLVLYVVGRLCHEEWQNPYPCVAEPDALENQFTLANALWFNLGAVLLQGSEVAPVAYGTRAVASAWWLFALVITSSYTANLATLLAQKMNNELIHNVNELAYNEHGIDYGAKANGSTYTFFAESKNKLYHDIMYAHMSKHKQPATNPDGIKKVNETYAFLMESTTIEYETQRNCEVTKVGGLLDSKGYGIAMKKNSTYRQALNLALLNLQERGVLREMKDSWWNEKNGGGACKAEEEKSGKELAMANFRGLFLVLAVGCALGVVLSCADLAVGTARRARAARQPFSRLFLAELRFVFRFETSVKPITGPLSDQSSDTESERVDASAASPGAGAGLGAGEGTEDGGAGDGGARLSGGGSRRRRSSMHAASLRLARHTARNSPTPSRSVSHSYRR